MCWKCFWFGLERSNVSCDYWAHSDSDMLASQNAEVSFVFLGKCVAGQKISLSILMVSNQGNRSENTVWDEFTFKGLVHKKNNPILSFTHPHGVQKSPFTFIKHKRLHWFFLLFFYARTGSAKLQKWVTWGFASFLWIYTIDLGKELANI